MSERTRVCFTRGAHPYEPDSETYRVLQVAVQVAFSWRIVRCVARGTQDSYAVVKIYISRPFPEFFSGLLPGLTSPNDMSRSRH